MPTKNPVIPEIQIDTVEAEIKFAPHPDGCGTLMYESASYMATVGGDDCKCSEPNRLRIMSTFRFPDSLLNPPKIWVDQTFESQSDAVAYAKRWVAYNQNMIFDDFKKIQKAAQEDFDAGKFTREELIKKVLDGDYDPPGVRIGPADPDTKLDLEPITDAPFHKLTDPILDQINVLRETALATKRAREGKLTVVGADGKPVLNTQQASEDELSGADLKFPLFNSKQKFEA